MTKWTRFVAMSGLPAVLLLLAPLQAAADTTSVTDQLELRIEVLDELLSPVPDNAFLEGAVIVIRGMLYAPAALDAKAEADQAEARMRAMEEGAADPESLTKARSTETEAGRRFRELSAQLESSGLVARGLDAAGITVYARSGDDSIAGPANVTTRRVTDETRLRVGSLAASATNGVLVWEFDSKDLGAGRWRVQATSAEFCPPREADFEIVPAAAGTPEQRMSLAYVNARVALAHGDTTEAVRLAQEAVSLGPPLHLNILFSYRLLGDVYYQRGQRQAALEAYRQAVTIAQTAFPKSRIPYILEPRISELEQE